MDRIEARAWAHDEFGAADLGDGRRTARLVAMATEAVLRPHGRVSQVFRQAAARQGAYDFLESAHVTEEAIDSAVGDACANRAANEPYVYIPIDGTSVNLADQAKQKDFGSVGSRERGARGLKIINAIAVSPNGVPLGVAAMKWWARGPKPSQKRRQQLRTEEKETQHWLDNVGEVLRRFEKNAPSTRLWFQADREGDAQHLLKAFEASGHWFTVRSNSDRRLHPGGPLPPRRYRKDCPRRRYLRRYLSQKAPIGFTYLEVPARAGQPSRVARMAIRAARVDVLLQDRRTSSYRTITLNAVWTREHGRGPMQATRSGMHRSRALDWLLLTNYPVNTLTEAERVVFGYAQRWRIEDFHKAWKSGVCNVEQTQLRARAHVVKWATVLAAVAIRAERLKHLSRTQPTLPASEHFSSSEIQALILLKRRHRKRTEVIDDVIPTLEIATRWVAELGGYTGKSSGGPPGSTTISRGLECIRIAAEVLEEVGEQRKKR